MKAIKRILIACFLLLALTFCLYSCGECEHNWKTKNCESGMECTLCGERKDASHSWREAGCLVPKMCTECGITEGEPAGHKWSEAVCLTSQSCSVCKKTSSIVEHDWQRATCASPRNCPRCGLTEGAPLMHTWLPATCTAPSTCSGCGLTQGNVISHSWVVTSCDEPQICSVCSATGEAPGHKFKPATCTSAGTCRVCSETFGSALGHNWVNASCTEPEHCTRCNESIGEALGHDWKFTQHIDPSCSVGKDIYSCHCGEEKVTTYPATIFYHTANESGLCTVCNTQFDLSKMKLKSMATDSKYVLNEGVFTSDQTPFTIYKPITFEDIDMPIIDLNGDISKVTKTNIAKIPFKYKDGTQEIECYIEIKVQGASSANYAKKNYNIKLYVDDTYTQKNKVKLVKGWGKESKYCLKANWVDFSQARNVVSAQIFGDIVRSRGLEDELSDTPNGGAIDGFPVLVYNNGDFLGLYTLNIPKDKWMFDMKDSDEKNQAILMGEHWNTSVALNALINRNNMGSSGWELEFASNEESLIDNDTTWVIDSMNRVIDFVMNNDGKKFVDGIDDYVDVDKCIDSMIYTFFICAGDNTSKNILWVTYDGKIWFSSVYDMDGTWGLKWNGSVEFTENSYLISGLKDKVNSEYNLLWEKLYIYCFDRVVARYKELRQGPLSIANISNRFMDFFSKIPEIVYQTERSRWPNVPSNSGQNDLNQLLSFAEKRIEKFDSILRQAD